MEDLLLLERLIVEFHDPYISYQRRREIENDLASYENKPDSWKYSLRYLEGCANILVRSFCLKLVENVICKRWSKITTEDKMLIHSTLHRNLFDLENDVPPIARRQLMKLLAKIARNEWPLVCSSFMDDIFRLITAHDSHVVILGLSSLLIASEELINPREDLSTARKFEIRRHFEIHIPHIFLLLNGTFEYEYVDSTFQKFKSSGFETEIYESILEVYSQLFSWIPLSDVYTGDLLTPIFECVGHNSLRVKLLALTSLNEILYKNCVPNKFIPLIATIFCEINGILDHLTNSGIENLDAELLTKMLETITLFFSTHWHRIEANVEVAAIMSFLFSFYTLSFHRVSLQYYDSCLDIWCNFLEYLTMRHKLHVKHYENLLSTLLREMMCKLQDNSFENKSEEECDFYFNRHINVIESLVELLPSNVFTNLFDTWNAGKTIYIRLLMSEGLIDLSAENVSAIEILHKFEVSTQILTSLSSKIDIALNELVAQNLLEIVNLANREFTRPQKDFHIYCRPLLKVHCQALKAIPTWLPFSLDKNNSVIINTVSTTLPFLIEKDRYAFPELQISAAFLVASLISRISQVASLQPLFVDPTFKHLPIRAQRLLQCALCSWVCNCKGESFAERLNFLKNLFELITSNKIENLENITNILRDCKITHSEGKDILLVALQPWLQYVVEVYADNFFNSPQLCEMLTIFLFHSFYVLQDHVETTIVQKMLVIFDECFSNHVDWQTPSTAVGKMILLLTVLMENPGRKYRDCISGVISVAQKVFSRMKMEENGTIVSEFCKLLCCLLLNKWSYFCKGVELNEKSEISQRRRAEFEFVLSYIVKSFYLPDVDILKNNLHCLEETNVKWNLYNKELFRMKYLPMVLDSLLTILIENSHQLLTEEILTAIYHMAAVDFQTYFNQYIPLFLNRVAGLTKQQNETITVSLNPQTDMPSFVHITSTMINDIRSYKLENGYS